MSQADLAVAEHPQKNYHEINSLLGDLRRARISRGIGVTVRLIII